MSDQTTATGEPEREEPTHRLPITERLQLAVETMGRARAASPVTPVDFIEPTDGTVPINPTS